MISAMSCTRFVARSTTRITNGRQFRRRKIHNSSSMFGCVMHLLVCARRRRVGLGLALLNSGPVGEHNLRDALILLGRPMWRSCPPTIRRKHNAHLPMCVWVTRVW